MTLLQGADDQRVLQRKSNTILLPTMLTIKHPSSANPDQKVMARHPMIEGDETTLVPLRAS